MVIYDFGMNNGDDVAYYLKKDVRIVGVEANKALCDQVCRRFPEEIAAGRLTVLNVALSDRESAEPLTFYIHKTNHVLSQLPRPEDPSQFDAVDVPCRTPASIVSEFGEPLYIKIDVEHFDGPVLRNLFQAGIFPPEISAEAHSVEVFALMVANGYNSFSLVDGATVSTKYGSTTIETLKGPQAYSFPYHSAGPFGADIRERWDDADTFLHTLSFSRLGWKDIHASTVIPPSGRPRERTLAARQVRSLASRTASGLAEKLRTTRQD